MPITLPPIARRQFLVQFATGISLWSLADRLGAGSALADANRFALFADTHIAGDSQTVARNVNMTDHFVQAAREVLECDPRPAAVLVAGDCAYSTGTAEEYRQLKGLLGPLREAQLPVHCALGNHDHRQRFWEIVTEGPPPAAPLHDRHVTVIDAPHATWYLLDSLDETQETSGALGSTQLAWLAQELDRRGDKPSLVMLHHNPHERPESSGLVDTRDLLELLASRSHVKALFFGHSHGWAIRQEKGLYWVNLPPVAYVFSDRNPSGWVDCRLHSAGLALTVRCIDKQHALNEQSFALKW